MRDRRTLMSGLTTWMIEVALPFWSRAGFDATRGVFAERLDWSGRPLAVPLRAMVQARQIYVYAHAARLGWFADGADLAVRAMARLQADCCERYGGQASFAFSVDGRGRIASPVRDAYAHAFILFALAHLHRLNGDARLLALADEVTVFVESRLTDLQYGGLFDRFPVEDRAKRQNPLMHLLEAYLALEETAPGRGYVNRAGAVVALFRHRLFDPATGVLSEHFAQDWSEHPEPAKRSRFEPGHHFEWIWLLAQYGAMTGQDTDAWTTALFESAVRNGVLPSGLIVDEVTREGHVSKGSHRVWPHAEAVKAAVTRHASGDRTARAFAQRTAAALGDSFLDRPFPGGWIDHVDGEGAPLVDYVPASSLYHLFLAATEMAQPATGDHDRS